MRAPSQTMESSSKLILLINKKLQCYYLKTYPYILLKKAIRSGKVMKHWAKSFKLKSLTNWLRVMMTQILSRTLKVWMSLYPWLKSLAASSDATPRTWISSSSPWIHLFSFSLTLRISLRHSQNKELTNLDMRKFWLLWLSQTRSLHFHRWMDKFFGHSLTTKKLKRFLSNRTKASSKLLLSCKMNWSASIHRQAISFPGNLSPVSQARKLALLWSETKMMPIFYSVFPKTLKERLQYWTIMQLI